MLLTIFTVLTVLWVLGFVTSFMMGGLIHLFLIVAFAAMAIRILQEYTGT